MTTMTTMIIISLMATHALTILKSEMATHRIRHCWDNIVGIVMCSRSQSQYKQLESTYGSGEPLETSIEFPNERKSIKINMPEKLLISAGNGN